MKTEVSAPVRDLNCGGDIYAMNSGTSDELSPTHTPEKNLPSRKIYMNFYDMIVSNPDAIESASILLKDIFHDFECF